MSLCKTLVRPHCKVLFKRMEPTVQKRKRSW